MTRNDKDLGRLASPKTGGPKRMKMEPEMYPKVPPKWSPFGPPESAKAIAILCVFAQNGGPKGPRFEPENDLENHTKPDPKST